MAGMTSFRTSIVAAVAVLAVSLGGCSAAADNASVSTTAVTATAENAALDETKVHSIAIEVDEETLKEMLLTYLDTGDKEWVSATVTIDAETFQNVGIKLKGNSSLRQITMDTPPEELPLRIRLDKYVDDQNVDGISDVTVRSNTTETAMNEAVALDLLADAGLASEPAVATRFSVNGSAEELRLTVQNLDDTWVGQTFPDAGDSSVLYKSDADGDWAWHGDDGDYSSSFDVEAGADNYAPLIELLDLVNNGTAAEISEKLPTLLDVNSFASYLAFEEIVDNVDDIDGPGNNSYLFWDSASQQFTVVAWDHNLAFGASNGDGPGDGAGGGPRGGNPAEEATPSAQDEQANGQDPSNSGDGGPGGGDENPLSAAFLANADWKALYEQARIDLQASLVDDGTLTETLDQWTQLLTTGAGDLVSSDVLTTEADQIRGTT